MGLFKFVQTAFPIINFVLQNITCLDLQ